MTVVCGQCGAELVPSAPHPGGLDMWEPHECRGMTDMAERGAKSTPDTWPQARRVEVARHVLTTARVPELVTEVERLREALHRLTHVVREPGCPLCGPEQRGADVTDRMTPEDARERLAFYATFSDAVDQITSAYDALAVLVDWPELLKAGERAGKVEQGVGVPYGIEWRSGTPSPEEWLRATAGTTPVWRLVPREHGSEEETT